MFTPRHITDIADEQLQLILSISVRICQPIFAGLDSVRRCKSLTVRYVREELERRGLRLCHQSYYRLIRGQKHTASVLLIANIADILRVDFIDAYHIGVAVLAGESPDLSRYGIEVPAETRS